MGRRRPPAETWPTPDVQRRQAATVQRWTTRCATGAPLTPGEDQDMRDDWQRDQPPRGKTWPSGWWARFYRLRLSLRRTDE